MSTGDYRPAQEPSNTCPNCGYCPSCGRANIPAAPPWSPNTIPWYPVFPYSPYIYPYDGSGTFVDTPKISWTITLSGSTDPHLNCGNFSSK